VQNVSTFGKVGALGLIVVGGFFATGGGPGPIVEPAAHAQSTLSVAGLVGAFMGIFWAYEGWYQMPFNAAELKRPERNLPLGLILGMVILITVYLLINIVYLRAVPFEEMQAMAAGTPSTHVATLTVARIFSPEIAGYLTLLIAISIFGAANPNMLSSPRAFYAMGQDGLVPSALTRVSPRWGTPTVAIWVQAAVGIVLVLMLETFGDTTDFVVFAAFIFYALTVAAVYRLRWRRPDLPRPYRCTGYPLTPALFIVVAIAFVAAVLDDEKAQQNARKGLVIVLAGLPYYWGWTAWRRRRAT
jgi:APA family basic amino acid/polyamine antiporter